jgi:hypothetical protein
MRGKIRLRLKNSSTSESFSCSSIKESERINDSISVENSVVVDLSFAKNCVERGIKKIIKTRNKNFL